MANPEYSETDMSEEEDSTQESQAESQEESQEETCIETVVDEVLTEHEDEILDYVIDPKTPEEMVKSEAIKKFAIRDTRKRLLDSYEEHRKWLEDEDLVTMDKKCKKMIAKDELDPSTAMKRIIKENFIIAETVEQHLEDMVTEMSEESEESESED
jgi:hypothetical protein